MAKIAALFHRCVTERLNKDGKSELAIDLGNRGSGIICAKGEVVGDSNLLHLQRVQIRETIKAHFEKERQLFKKGIKCLSLFFIGEVAKYSQYDADGQPVKRVTQLVNEISTDNVKYHKVACYQDLLDAMTAVK